MQHKTEEMPVSDVEEILADVRKRRSGGARMGSRIALALAGTGVAAAIAAGATLGASATASISRQGFGSPESAVIVYESTTKYVPATGGNVPSEEELGALGVADGASDETAASDGTASSDETTSSDGTASPVEPPKYDALTDLGTIPPPPSSWSAEELANAKVWLKQQSIIADCMLQKGFEYEFSPWWTWPADYRPGSDTGEVEYNVEEGIALHGEPDRALGDDYDWREAGCDGYAVHVTGMDNAN